MGPTGTEAKAARITGWRSAVRGRRAGRRLAIAAAIATAAACGLKPAIAAPGVAPEPHPSATPVLVPKPLDVIQKLGDKAWAETRESKLLSRQEPNRQPGAYDQFRVEIRGKFRGLPPVKITLAPPQPKPMPGAAVKPAPVAAASPTPDPNLPTWEKAVNGLPVGAINVWTREVLIGSRSVREGDLMIVEFKGKSFPVWVRRVSDGEVEFCDAELQQSTVKPVRIGPKELPDGKEDELTPGTLFLRPK